MQPVPLTPLAPLTRTQRLGVVALMVVVVGFGALVEYRSTCLRVRHTDLNIYLRAARALRDGASPYEFTTTGDAHYNYPPLLAILLMPFAEAPVGGAGLPAVPFAVSVALWYLLGVLAAGLGVHRLASALERSSIDGAVRHLPPGCWRWWTLRLVPLLACLPGVARTLSLGQVDLLVLLLLCETAAAALRGRSGRAGLCLAGATCVKLIPAFLLIYPLWRRDRRWLATFAAGLALGWGALPAAVLGPKAAFNNHRQWADVVVLPPLGLSADRTRESDLNSMANVNSQSLVAIFHAFQHPEKALRPAQPGQTVKRSATLIGAALVLVTLAASRRWPAIGPAPAITFGSLVTLMLLMAPVCHPHYFCHWLPLVQALWAADLERCGNRSLYGRPLLWLFALNATANALTSVPGLEILRDRGLATAAGVLLWVAGVVVLLRPALRRGAAPADAVQSVLLPPGLPGDYRRAPRLGLVSRAVGLASASLPFLRLSDRAGQPRRAA
jgi:hypothetical protein